MMRMLLTVFAAATVVAAPSSVSAQGHVPGRIPGSGLALNYVREGSGPVLFVVGSSVYYPRAFSQRLRGHFDLVFADARHFVPSYQPESAELDSLTLDSFVEDVETARRGLGIDRMALLGHSVHAQIALAYAAKYPEKVNRLILLAGVPFAFSELGAAQQQLWASATSARKDAMLANQAKLATALKAAGPTRSFAVTYQLNTPLYWADPHYDATHLLSGLENSPAISRLLRSVPSRSEVRTRLAALGMPVLVVLGRLDYAIPHQAWEQLIAGLPHVTYRLIDQSSHNPQTEHADTFDTILIDWMQTTPRDD